MSVNARIAEIFDEMASVLELTGANPFRIGAFSKVARIVRDYPVDLATLADDHKKLTAIDGIGEGSAKKIIEFVQTGRVAEHDELLTTIPPGLTNLLKIPGLGPKTIYRFWKEADVTDLETLKAKLASGELAKLPRMGEKTLQNISKSIEFIATASERMRLGEAMPIAEDTIALLQTEFGVTQIEFAGSLRRGCETIGDIDILAVAADPAALYRHFQSLPQVQQVLVAGESKCSVRFNSGIQVDLRIFEKNAFGAALMYFTGSKAHNIVLRERAIKMGFRLNEYGLFKDVPDDKSGKPIHQRGQKAVASKTEEDIYTALKLPFIPPELREDTGEFKLTKTPHLITLEDIRAELHAHTTASDGHWSITQLAQAAADRGFHTIAVTDHSKSSVQANGLSPERLRAHIKAIRKVAKQLPGITILAGAEVDILTDGSLDYDDELLAELDIVVASPHASLKQEPALATKRLLKAVTHPLVHILGHPTGRIINRREGLNPAMNEIIAAAKEHNTALEINANHLRLDLRDAHVHAVVEAGGLIAIDTDAHGPGDLDELRYG
ncbi:MAG TPA: DNA polymerase/3'-5' exonuclease PolX, partial [Phycisphaerales bacterium]|nr:DNA polymerase/3'-5' exonuclease PolX [Phycisphaerales bacterium]